LSDRQNDGDSFDLSRAEVFEALGHPTRIRIVQTLANGPMGFAELKRDSGIESNGLLVFHVGKLEGLVKQNSEGSYALTDEGREALRIIDASKSSEKNGTSLRGQKRIVHIERGKLILAVLLVTLLILASIVFVQQEELSSANSFLDSNTVIIGGSRYWTLTESLVNLTPSKSFYVDGVNFTTVFPQNGYFDVENSSMYIIPGSANSQNSSWLGLPIPEVAVNFGDGHIEYWNNFTETLNPVINLGTNTQIVYPGGNAPLNLTILFHGFPSGMWISQHNNPRAGIKYDPSAGTISFFVSVD